MVDRALWQSRFLVPAATVELFLDALEGEALSVSAFEETGANGHDGLWRIELIQSGQPDRLALAGRLAPLRPSQARPPRRADPDHRLALAHQRAVPAAADRRFLDPRQPHPGDAARRSHPDPA
jgi:hypothetical protein